MDKNLRAYEQNKSTIGLKNITVVVVVGLPPQVSINKLVIIHQGSNMIYLQQPIVVVVQTSFHSDRWSTIIHQRCRNNHQQGSELLDDVLYQQLLCNMRI